MYFASNLFLFVFLPLLLALYNLPLLNRSTPYRKIILLGFSMVFFAWNQPRQIAVLIFSIFVNYLLALAAERFRHNKIILLAAVLINIGILFFYKYFVRIFSILKPLLNIPYVLPNITMPIGVSFFTFQGLSYVIDVCKGKTKACRSLIDTALYISLFPQLIAGPILRFSDMEYSLQKLAVSIDDFLYGFERFVFGLGKKVLIADVMAVVVDNTWADMRNGIGISAVTWIAGIAYMMQIYFDFSGYSDMAIGLGRMLGFNFSENFNAPYSAVSIRDFWRRWHITLSSWFRDYVYIPLGGKTHPYRNTLIVFTLTGIWHGCGLTFLVWGIYNAVFIIIERLVQTGREKKGKQKEASAAFKVVSRAATLFIIDVGFIIFRADSMSLCFDFLANMFGRQMGNTSVLYPSPLFAVTLAAAILILSGIVPKAASKLKRWESYGEYIRFAGAVIVLFMSAVNVMAGKFNPFIYFRF